MLSTPSARTGSAWRCSTSTRARGTSTRRSGSSTREPSATRCAGTASGSTPIRWRSWHRAGQHTAATPPRSLRSRSAGRDNKHIITGMHIAVFGTGPVGRALAGGLLNPGHSVTVGTRAPEDPAVVARLADLPGVSVMAHRDAAKTAELAIFAIPFDGLTAVAGEITGTLPPGITLIDACDPERPGPDGRPVLVIGHDDSGA